MSFQRGVAVPGYTFQLLNKSTGEAVTSGTVSGYRSRDGAAQESLDNSGSITHLSGGIWTIDLTSSDMTAGLVGIAFVHTDALLRHVTIKTGPYNQDVAVPGFTFGMVDRNTGDALTSGTVTGVRTLDGAATEVLDNSGSITHLGNGQWAIDLTAADMNGDAIGLAFSSTNAASVFFAINPGAGLIGGGISGIINALITLWTDGGLDALITGGLHLDEIPKGTKMPYAVLEHVTGAVSMRASASSLRTVYEEETYQVRIHTKTGFAALETLANAVKAIFNGASLVMSTGSSISVQYENQTTAVDPDEPNGRVWAIDYRITRQHGEQAG